MLSAAFDIAIWPKIIMRTIETHEIYLLYLCAQKAFLGRGLSSSDIQDVLLMFLNCMVTCHINSQMCLTEVSMVWASHVPENLFT